jgi:hypothetical protein
MYSIASLATVAGCKHKMGTINEESSVDTQAALIHPAFSLIWPAYRVPSGHTGFGYERA